MKRKTKNRILKGITITSVIMAILSIMCLDSDSWIPVIVLGISVAWILLFSVANFENL